MSEFDFKFRREMIVKNDLIVLDEKGRTYGDSWKKRGGVGAFMMLARKWDRIENQMQVSGYDIFKCNMHEKDGLLDDIQDLRRYLLLVEEELIRLNNETKKNQTEFQPLPMEMPKIHYPPGVRTDDPFHPPYKVTCDADPGRGYVNQDL
jgi:hypothetical protein